MGFHEPSRVLFNRIVHTYCGYRCCRRRRSHISNMRPDRFKSLMSRQPFTIFIGSVGQHPIPISTLVELLQWNDMLI